MPVASDRTGVTEQLVQLGMTRNEAVAYLTLVEDHSTDGLTGYEVAARSGIPRSAVYAVLRKLEEASAAFAYGTGPVRYVAIAPTDLVDHMRRTTTTHLDGLADSLGRLPKRSRPEPVWILRRYDEVLGRTATMIRTAQHSLYLSIWPRELAVVEDHLVAAVDRGLHLVLHVPMTAGFTLEGASLWIEDRDDDAAKEQWSHKALVVADRREALIGGAEPEADNHAVWTTNPSLVDVATNHIILDITLMAQRQGRDCAGDVAPMMRPHLPGA